MTRRTAWLAAIAMAVLAGCGASRHYTIPADEAKRAAKELKRAATARVLARDEAGGVVTLEVDAGDELLVPDRASTDPSAEAARIAVGDLERLGVGAEELTLYRLNKGPMLVGMGGGMLGGAWLMMVIAAGIKGEGTWAIPFAGPVLMAKADGERVRRCEDQHPDGGGMCDFGAGLDVLMAGLDMALQLVGAGLLVAGGLAWESGPEILVKDADGETAFSFTLEPAVMGEGGAGGLITGRF
jgi:hypothetical protein